MDREVIQELKASLKKTEVDHVKEALREAEIHNLDKHPKADAAVTFPNSRYMWPINCTRLLQRVWLKELQVEVALFDVIRAQKNVTDETQGSTKLLKLLSKAHGLNKKRSGPNSSVGGGAGAPGQPVLSPGLVSAAAPAGRGPKAVANKQNVVARMAAQDARS